MDNIEKIGYSTLTKETAKIIHDFLYSNIKFGDQENATFIAGVLIALSDNSFRNTYKGQEDTQALIDLFMSAINRKIDNFEGLNFESKAAVKATFDFIKHNKNLLNSVDNTTKSTCLHVLTEIIEDNIYQIAKQNPTYDVLSEFYNQFASISSQDQSTLGIVPTPYHIAHFMSDLLDINENDIIMDTCCGTSSLLLAAGHSNPILGVEMQARMIALSVANMIIRDKVNCNLWLGDSWNDNILNQLKDKKPTKFIMNPPYAQEGFPELGFVKKALDILQPEGLGVVIMPMSTAIKQDNLTKNLRQDILNHHQLLATFSMPDQLFYPVGVVTIVMLFRAHTPNEESTFFGYLKDDGFEITRTEGRKDKGKWIDIRNEMFDLYNNFESKPSKSATELVTGTDEWCCEAYMETDYAEITPEMFMQEMKAISMRNLWLEV